MMTLAPKLVISAFCMCDNQEAEPKRMNVEQLRPAIVSVRNLPLATDSRAATYLRTYPAFLTAAQCEGIDDTTRFLRLSAMAYGWMPRVLRLNADHLDKAISALRRARSTKGAVWDDEIIGPPAACLCSVVGASKFLTRQKNSWVSSGSGSFPSE
jgi:hypothetical protein